ncbi:MAG TPA: hypothetical protein VHS36_09775, partial [Candidatus Limnocylindrales bacterium]|nr:hypothetical protein [Candidatus Limnocylindrales bacterium]
MALSLVAVATLVSQVPAFPGSRPAGSTSRDPGASSAGGARSSDPVPSASGDPAATSPQPRTPSAGAPSGSAAGSGPPATPIPNGSLPPGPAASAIFPGGLLIADRGNGRLLVVNDAGRLLWSFPGPGSLPHGQQFSADDAFVAPDGRTIVANDEAHQVIDRIDIASRRVIWQYGHYSRAGAGAGFLHTPDDAYPLANGDIVVADIRNCRIMQIAPTKQVVHQ